MTLSLCVAGCGRYAASVLNDVSHTLGDVDLLFASRDIEKARQFNHRYGGVGFFGSYEEAAADRRIDAMYFVTPHNMHLGNAILAARNAKHILMEKPIARTITEASQIIKAARDAGVKLMVAENHRFLPTVTRAKELIQAGAIGTIRYIQGQAESYNVSSGWRANIEQVGGGMVIDGGIHYISEMVYLGGFPTKVYASIPPASTPKSKSEDGVFLTAQLPLGAIGSVSLLTGTPVSRDFHRVAVTGMDGQISFVPFGREVTLNTPRDLRVFQVSDHGRGVRQMIAEFRDCIVDDRNPKMSGEDGLRDLAVVLAAYRSTEIGQPVSLADLKSLDTRITR